MRLLTLCLVLGFTLGVAGCETMPRGAPAQLPSPGPADAPPADAARVDAAIKAEEAGDYIVAARQYEQLAQTALPPQRQHYLLSAVDALIKGGWLKPARQTLDSVVITGLDVSVGARKRVLEARLALAEGTPQRAIPLLEDAARVREISPTLHADIHQARAQTELALNRPLNAVQQLIEREQYLAGSSVNENQTQLWRVLESLSREQLLAELPQARDPTYAGWIELALAAREHGRNVAALTQGLAQWRARHEKHPAGAEILESLTRGAPALVGRLERIALLLPLTSDFGVAAQAIRDGFLAMHARTPEAERPKITIYDLGANPALAAQVYQRAVQDGAQVIVGPLGREATDTVVRQSGLAVPTLLLNHTDEQPPGLARLYQFGLPPEQEARDAAERAYFDGCRQAAVLYPTSTWGERVMTAFTSHWQRLGGVVLGSQAYLDNVADYADPVKRLLNIPSSESRKALIERQIGTRLTHDVRPRQDIECLFLAADARAARLIKPQLNYFNARLLPVYATSHIFTGKTDPIHDIDLDDIQFGDMPWMLASSGRIAELRKLQGDWPYARSDLDRLYALGIDSYAILPHLNRISAENAARFNGVTSALSLDRDGRLNRQLAWARFRNGVPRLIVDAR